MAWAVSGGRRWRGVVAAAVLLVACRASAQSSFGRLPPAPESPEDARIDRLMTWLIAVDVHQPGERDSALTTVGAWNADDLRQLNLDAQSMLALVADPRTSRFVYLPRNSKREIRIAYSSNQLARLRALACAASGGLATRRCVALPPEHPAADALERLAAHVRDARSAGDVSYLLHRSALLHTDIVTLGVRSPGGLSMTSATEMFFSLGDGTITGLNEGPEHWEMARAMLDRVTPDGERRPNPGADRLVRDWYVATIAWMEAVGSHSVLHRERAEKLFRGDPDVEFLAGCQHETFATASIQEPVKGVRFPYGFSNPLRPPEGELREAAARFRAALDAKPDMHDARLRLGHVLVRLERYAEAVGELRRVLPALTGGDRRYYALMFLGAAEEALAHDSIAENTYREASALFPAAQSPYIALSQLAWRRNRAGAANDALQRMFAISSDARSGDPWWNYQYEAFGDPEARLDALRRRVTETKRP